MSPRTVLVTGASRGLGRELAVAYATEGANVIGTGRDSTALDQTGALCDALPGTFSGHRLDVLEAAEVAELVNSIGHIDICIANAGIAEQRPLLETTLEDVKRLLDVNFLGAYTVMHSAAKVMVGQGSGRLVAIASDAAFRGIPTMVGYVASKHALLGLARTFALELAPTGVHMTTVFPGPIHTEILGKTPPAVPRLDPREVAVAVVAITSLGSSVGSGEFHLQPDQTQ